MKRTMINLVLVGALMVAVSAGAQGLMGMIQQAEHAGPDAIAAAILSPVGAVDGWGRIGVMDENTSEGVRREARIMVFGLDPETTYTALADGVELATFVTDATGTAFIRLEDGDDGYDPVPADLPPAEELVSALVVDASGAAVLEGDFTVFTPGSGPGSWVYRETIPLLDMTGGFAHGMARVERDADDSQEFSTRAAGLEPGTQYQIVVDGILAGVVTAGPLGYAELELRAPDDENPLPDTLQPVEDLRLVEWQLLDGSVVLSGSFTGTQDGGGHDGDGDGSGGGHDGDGGAMVSLHGMIAGFVEGGFLLQNGMGVVTVQVTDSTEFDGFSSLDELAVGMGVEVDGDLQGDVVVATRVELMDGDGSGGGHDGDGDGSGGGHDGDGGAMVSLHGMIAGFVEGGFLLQNGMGVVTVQVTDSTEFDGFSSLDELAVGMGVEVDGEPQGDLVVATRIEIMDGSGGGGMF